MNFKIRTGLSLGIAALFSSLSYSQLTISNPETLANVTTVEAQQNPAISMDTLGRYVVVWESEGQDGDGFGIYAKVYAANHSVVKDEFLINTVSQTGDQRFPDVAMNADGTWCVVWQSNESESTNGWDVYRRVYDASGTAVTSRSRLHASVTNNQMRPAVAGGDNYFVCAYMSGVTGSVESKIEARFFNDAGTYLATNFDVAVSTGNHLAHPDVAMDNSGNAYFVWQADGLDGDRQGVYAAGYAQPSLLNFGPVQVNTETAGNQQEPNIASDGAGNAVVVWSSFDQDGDHYGVYAQQMNSAGSLIGSEFIVANSTAGSQDHASVTSSREGGKFIFSWTDELADGDMQGIYARLFEAGSFSGTEQLMNTTTASRQMLSDVAIGLETNEAVFAWQGGLRKATSTGTDPNDFGVYTTSASLVDVTPPTAVCQDITVFLDATGVATITAGDVDGGSTDNVGITSYSINTSSFSCANIGFNAVTLTVQDAAGLSDDCLAIVEVVDVNAPILNCQNVTAYLDGAGNAIITAADIDAGSTDNCGAPMLSASQTAFTCADVGANSVTLTGTDASGNSSSCTSIVTVIDSVAPTASCQNITVYLDGSGVATITSADIDNGSTDNCGLAALSVSPSSFTCSDIGTNTVTLTATDLSSNSDVCTATVTVIDSVSPSASCQDITVYLDGSGNATITSGDVDGGSSDNCGIASMGLDVSSFTCANVGANNVTLTVTDASGNTNSCNSTVTVLDTISPVAVCQNITVYLDGAGNATIIAADIDGGSTDNCGVPILSASQTAFTCADAGANNVTLTATDVSGNISQCTAIVTIADSTSPTAVCQDITVFLDGTGNVSITAGDMDGGSVDNCGLASFAISQSSFTCADVGANTVTLTVTDAAGNSAACSGTVTIVDSITPTAVCQNITVYLDGSGAASITAADVDGGSTDNCGMTTLGIDVSSFTCANVGANNVTLTATDGSGNSASCTATVTVVDSISPTAVCQNITVFLDGSGNASITAADIDGGSSDNCSTPTLSASATAFTCANVGANSVTLTVTDAAGNSSTCSAIVTVSDTTSPVASCQDITVYLDATGNATITSGDLDNGSTDNCALASLSVSQATFTCANLGSNIVSLTATDVSGNNSSCSSTVTVLDTISPTTPVLADITGDCSATATAPTTTDNCGGTITGTTTDPLIYNTQGAFIITWTFDDGNGNTATATQNVIVDDVTPPVSPLLVDITGECAASVVAPTTTDICAGSITGTTTDPLTYTAQGTYVITWTFDDGNGNTSTAFQNVIVDDVTAPVTPTLADVTGECSATATAPTTTDNCAGTVTGTTTDPITYTSEGTYVITWTFDDGNGNITTAAQNVIVDDVTAPFAPTLADLTGECSVSATAPTTTDNCSGTVTGTTMDPLTYNTQGTFVITWTFDDGNGNTSTATQNVIIDDVTPPTASNIDTVFAECIGDVAVDVTLVDDEADNCSITPIVTHVGDVASNGTGCNDTITRTYNVADDAGNNIDVVQIIVLNDITAPTASNPDTVNVQCLGDVPAADPLVVNDEADNCGAPTVAFVGDVSSNGTGCNDTITRTYSVTDACGNQITVEQIIIVNDDTAPVVDVATLTDVTGYCDLTPSTPTATDNCSGALNGTADVTFPINTIGTTVVTWTYTDACGNVTMQTQNVIINAIDVSTTQTDDLTIEANNTASGVTYQWIDCEGNNPIAGATNQSYTTTYNGDFAVIVTQDGCSDTSACTTIDQVGLVQLTSEDFFLYPNPSTGQFTVSFEGNIQSLEMIDVTGRIVMIETELNEGMIDASLLAPGKYMVRLKSESGNILTKPIVIGQQ